MAGPGGLRACDLIRVPPPRLGLDLRGLLGDEQSADVVLEVDGEEIKVGAGGGRRGEHAGKGACRRERCAAAGFRQYMLVGVLGWYVGTEQCVR